MKYSHGQIMLLSVLLLSAIFSIVLSLSMSFTTNMQQTRLVGDSVRAFYAADTGIENGLYQYFKDKTATLPAGIMTNYTYCCDVTMREPQLPGEDLKITSTGYSPFPAVSNKLVRSIEVQGF
ncbi:MAG: hypothetical protein COX12_01550 [Candidatus Brennerbacteria bacterium CG23_combo_of_CG06-09_8_20_14_all_44_41]|uniref:Type 4 fimbrial biogenesis protein PilX N-terminal domain-containing protein n=1 Tax=Candidatus Brennerbacteria bacterium CG_4_8_14_3_um_filter_43_14 TaxID=1974521 RepID=A0A2H9N5R0_9BACT|nr:MAG: hypothetical protein AUJ43_00315 [Parcubacteria group bacterium CG1_02_44_31]PIP50376.1 MAG: hypothetical protein COX12_01550 [Candidatus Brennerbacteria bacterium CG23_combo_of_CG06-09_8_20_14_all_44_41]PIX29197.1 MAG: hypothetical protein COZ64_00810 [Candidatus Brennerbacteria bacterium CG_4_8_14_3_um_filter_43_14]